MPKLVSLLAIVWTLVGLVMMVIAAPAVPYADPWRFVAKYLAEPFPGNLLRVDNGHCEVLPELVRYLDLMWCNGDQSLQIGAGVVVALVVVAAVCSWARRDAVGAWWPAAFCVGVFWLGNGRKLAHGNECVPLFLILLLIATGLRLAGRPVGGRGLVALVLLGITATFTFGSGIACFVAFGAAMWMRRAERREWLALTAAGVTTLLTFLALASHQVHAGSLALGDRIVVWLHWLGAPFVSAASPLLDPVHAMRQPALVRAVAEPIAGWSQATFGDSATASYPAVAVGGVGVVWLLWATWRHRRNGGAELQRLALGIAWFSIAVGVLVAAVRLDYFRQRPDQIVSARYLPWSILLWTGLVMAHVAAPARSALVRAWSVLTFALLLLPSQVWNARAAFRLQQTAERTALGAAIGVLDVEFQLVESQLVDVQEALPLLQQAGLAMFAWPETKLLGQRVASLRTQPVSVSDLRLAPAKNWLGADAVRVQFRCEGIDAERLLLVDAAGIAQGMARVDAADRWLGWLRVGAPAGAVSVVRLQ